MSRQAAGRDDPGLPKFHVDPACAYVTSFEYDLGIAIDFKPREFDSDETLDEHDYVAEVVHWSAYLDPPDEATLFRLCRTAVQLYCAALRVRDLRRAVGVRQNRSPLSKARCRAARGEVRHENHRFLRIPPAGRRVRSDDRPAGRAPEL